MRQAVKEDLVIGNLVMVNYENSTGWAGEEEFHGNYKGYYIHHTINYKDKEISKVLPIIEIGKICEHDDNKIDFGSHCHYDSLILVEEDVDKEAIKLWRLWRKVREETIKELPCPEVCSADGEVEWSYKIDNKVAEKFNEILNPPKVTVNDIQEAKKLYYVSIIPSMIEHILKFWDISALPKEYEKYLETYEEYDELTEEEQKEIDDSFNLPLDTTAGTFVFPDRIAINNTAYSDTQQGVNPLETLLGSIWAYGRNCGIQHQILESKERIKSQEMLQEASKTYIETLKNKNDKLESKLSTIIDVLKENGIVLDEEIKLREEEENKKSKARADIANLLADALKDLEN